MTCIGGEKPAPKLKETKLAFEDLQIAYEQTVEVLFGIFIVYPQIIFHLIDFTANFV